MSLDLRERRAPAEKAGETALYQGLAGFRLALRKFLAFSEAALRSAGVTSQQYQAMLAIAASPGEVLTMKALAGELMLKPNGAVQLVDRLEALGMVVRSVSDADRRSVLLNLTSAGSSKLSRLARQHRAELLEHRDLLVESLERLAHIPN
jgi:DNA-binding MarR family transcriptional regulator